MLSRAQKKEALLVGFLVLLALVLRMVSLGHTDLWGDEILFVNYSTSVAESPGELATPSEIDASLRTRFSSIGHMPLAFDLQNLFLHLAGGAADVKAMSSNAELQRIPSVVWGVLSLVLVYLVARQLFARRIAFIALILFSVSFFPLFYSREAYMYTLLMLLSSSVMWSTLRLIGSERWHWAWLVCLTVSLSLTVNTHLTGALLPGSILVYSLAFLVRLRQKTGRFGVAARPWQACVLASIISLLQVLPFILGKLEDTGEHRWGYSSNFLEVVYTVPAKLFLGAEPWINIPVLLVLAFGVYELVRSARKSSENGIFLGITLLSFVAIVVSVVTTQFAVRYFSLVVPFLYIVFAYGLSATIERLAEAAKLGPKWSTRCLALSVLGYVCVQLLVFYPALLSLGAKSIDFGRVAGWLNTHLKDGDVYVLESAYEGRFIGGHYPTPKRVGAVPHVHTGADEGHLTLRRHQQNFLQQFPSAYYVEIEHHGTEPEGGISLGPWTWPHGHFQQKVTLENTGLAGLVRLGIWPESSVVYEKVLFTSIYFNNREDRVAMLGSQGRPVLIEYPPQVWIPVGFVNDRSGASRTYFRATQQAQTRVSVENISGATVTGKFRLRCRVEGGAKSYDLGIRVGSSPMVSATVAVLEDKPLERGVAVLPPRVVESGVLPVAPGVHSLLIEVKNAARTGYQALLVYDVEFVEQTK